MKIIWKILIAIALLLVLLVVMTHFILQAKLGEVINRVIIPEIERTLDLDVDMDDAGINLFGGSLRLSGVRLGNPNNFQEPTIFSMDDCKINIGLISTLKGITELTEARIDNAIITIVRNKDNQVNAIEISKAIPKPETTEETPELPQPEPDRPTQAEPLELPKLLIKDLSIETKLEYVDHKLRGEITRFGLQTKIGIKNLTTVENAGLPNGTITIEAHLDDKPDLFRTDIIGEILPITNPLKPTFTLKGSILAIDLTVDGIKELFEKADIQAESADLEIHLKCIDGIYQHPGSVILLKLKNCRPTGDLAKKNPDFPSIKELSAPLPIEGPVQSPRFAENPGVIIGNAILQNLTANADVLMDFLKKKTKKHDGKIQDGSNKAEEQIKKELDRGIKSLGKFFDKL